MTRHNEPSSSSSTSPTPLTVMTTAPTSPDPPLTATGGSNAPPKRHLGARRRGMNSGLFIANPDNSDEEDDVAAGPSSPSSRSPVRSSPVTASSSGSGNRLPRVGSAAHIGGHGLPIHGDGGPAGRPIPSLEHGSPHIPSIPAPQSSPLPFTSPMPSPQPPHMSPAPPMPASLAHPPLPPPQPPRHLQRSQTTPVPEPPPSASHQSRPSLGSSPFHHAPSSPSRALPPLPSPPVKSSGPSPVHRNDHSPHSLPPHGTPFKPGLARMSSPEDIHSPSGQSEGARSFGSMSSDQRGRAGSVHGKVKVQATIDNESFTIVEITGMQSAEGIKDRVFSKMRFRDDEYSNLSLYITDIDEQPDTTPLSNDALLHLCLTRGDAKGGLKFFIKQDHFADSATATVVPPVEPYMSNADRRADMPPLRTDFNGSQQSLSILPSGDGSTSASELRGTSSSSWSEIHADEATEHHLPRSTGMQQLASRRFDDPPSGSASSSALPTPPPVGSRSASDVRVVSTSSSPAQHHDTITTDAQRKGSITPSGTQVASSSSRLETGLGLRVEDDMDAATKALIEQLQNEEAAMERQLLEDEKLARQEQKVERDVWERMQEIEMENATLRRAQIEEDERRAREVEAEEQRQEEARRLADERATQEAARTAWEIEQREAEESRGGRSMRFADDRRERADHFRQQGGRAAQRPQTSFDSNTLPTFGRDRVSFPVPSSSRRTSDNHYDASRHHQYPTTNPIFDRPIYSPPATAQQYSPNHGSIRSPGGIITARGDAPATGDRNLDPRFRQMSGHDHPGHRNFVGIGAGTTRRQDSRSKPFAALNLDPELHAPSLQNTRSMDNLRPFSPPGGAPVSRPPYEGVPPRTAITPGPGVTEQRPYTPTDMYRSSSVERTQDGRYPDHRHISGSPSSPHNPYVSFPSPQPHARNGSTSSLGYLGAGTTSSPPPFGSRNSQDGARPATTGQLSRQPWTLSDGPSPPLSAHSMGQDDGSYYNTFEPRPRSGSASAAAYRELATASPRRASHAGEDQRSGHAFEQTEGGTWLAVPANRNSTGDSIDTMSIAGTVSSQATIRPDRTDTRSDEDSSNTARAEEWKKWQQQMYKAEDVDEPEATLFIAPVSSSSPKPGIKQSDSKPNLSVQTGPSNHHRLQRAPTFLPPRDSEEWHVRPEPEALYDNLDQFFPDLDLDKPIVDGGLTTPTTPAADSPSSLDSVPPLRNAHQPPPAEDTYRPLPPPLHPARNEIVKSSFNKGEHRKSIRLMAEHKRRTLFKDVKNVLTGADRDEEKKEKTEEKPKRRLSMWGHRIQEVTPARLHSGQVPPTIPESPASDGKPPTLRWVRGELIGRGSYGRVYLALNVSTGDMMAVKQVEMLQNVTGGGIDRRQQGMVEALKSEISLLKDLYHPNIVAYLGCEESPENLSIFLEYVPGGTIASIYRTENLPRFDDHLVRFFTKQILEGLAYLHQRNILHRDLKGDNILVDADGCCKISDFGISKQANEAYDSHVAGTSMKGSIFWMAPEMIQPQTENQQKSYSGKVDIWSLGCVVVEMYNGERPWAGRADFTAIVEIAQYRPPPITPEVKISESARDVLSRFFSIPENRPTAAEALRHPFLTDTDPSWSFAKSSIGKAVAQKGSRAIKSAASTTAS